MTKMRVHELAKELGMENKALMEVLEKKKIEVKSHMSSLEENIVADLKKELGKKPVEAKEENGKEEAAPKKKTIVQVFRPQNAKNAGKRPARQGNRQQEPGARNGQRPQRSAMPPRQPVNTPSQEKPAAAPQTEKKQETTAHQMEAKPQHSQNAVSEQRSRATETRMQ